MLTSENPKYQLKLGGGLMWLDAQCSDRYGKPYLTARRTAERNTRSIAYRKNAEKDPRLSQGVEFFAFLEMTADGFFTSEIGIKYLGYVENMTCLLSRMPSGARSLDRHPERTDCFAKRSNHAVEGPL